ncbi:hypothetical protein IHE45_04G042500 [Dioscorea alata]|uniref:Uncharacterized protein n=1 Tax=Dioscorea alata TaxID=55571 RepID=A0ACB7WC39_DIOAL|nr:hypothetical protein IHE45_04G042500 [Dioscorea alata]
MQQIWGTPFLLLLPVFLLILLVRLTWRPTLVTSCNALSASKLMGLMWSVTVDGASIAT